MRESPKADRTWVSGVREKDLRGLEVVPFLSWGHQEGQV